MKATQICAVDECSTIGVNSRGLCLAHYQRFRKYGELDSFPLAPPIPVAERLSSHLVQQLNGCLEWTGWITPVGGYGRLWDKGHVLTHRLAWKLANGPIPDGMKVCHHCDNPPCCQTEPTEAFPEGHLFLGTDADNCDDRVAKGRSRNDQMTRTHCPQGHPYDEANTITERHGWRHCRVCKRDADTRYRHKHRHELLLQEGV